MALITRTEEGWEFRPTPEEVRSQLYIHVVCLLVCLPVAGYFFWVHPHSEGLFCCGPLALLMAIVGLVVAITSWIHRKTPLLVERSGRITYGATEVCAAGTIEAVCVTSRSGEEGDMSYTVHLMQIGGRLIELPFPYFSADELRSGDTKKVCTLAKALAEALGVEVKGCVTEADEPAPDASRE